MHCSNHRTPWRTPAVLQPSASLLGPPLADCVLCLSHRRRLLQRGVGFPEQGPCGIQQRADAIGCNVAGDIDPDAAPLRKIFGARADALDPRQPLIPANPVLVYAIRQRDAHHKMISIVVLVDVVAAAYRDLRTWVDVCHGRSAWVAYSYGCLTPRPRSLDANTRAVPIVSTLARPA